MRRQGRRGGFRGIGGYSLIAPAGSIAGTVTIGGTLTATVTAGSPAPTYQWSRSRGADRAHRCPAGRSPSGFVPGTSAGRRGNFHSAPSP